MYEEVNRGQLYHFSPSFNQSVSSLDIYLKCQLCQAIVHEAQQMVPREATYGQILRHFRGFCDEVHPFSEICDSFIDAHFDEIFDLVEIGTHPHRICLEALGICTDSPFQRDLELLRGLTHEHLQSGQRLKILNQRADGHPYAGTSKRISGKKYFVTEVAELSLSLETLKKFTATTESALKFAAKVNLIANERTCPIDNCRKHMSLIKAASELDGFIWQCTGCKGAESPKMSVRHGSIFSNSGQTIGQVFELMHYWARHPKSSLPQISLAVHVSPSTVIDWYTFMTDVAEEWVDTHRSTNQLGGPGTIVEVDESLFFKRKYNRGRRIPEVWVFGLIERGTDDVYMEIVKKRDRTTLLAIIEQHVAPDTTIMTDGWRAYLGIPAMQQNYTHHWVNHQVCFVDPQDDQVHTQSIEATWGAVKRTLKHLAGTSKDMFPTYLFNYMFRRAHRNEKILENLIFWMSIFHNPNI